MLRFFFLYLLISSSTGFAEDKVPVFFEADYTIYRNGTKVGLMERRFFQQDDGKYAFHSESRTTGFIALIKDIHIIEKSIWDLKGSAFMPLNYSYLRKKNGKLRDVKIDFDWHEQRATNHVNGSKWTVKAKQGVLDKLLYQLSIMSDLMANNIPTYHVADGGSIKEYSFKRIGNEILTTPLGELRTIKLALNKKGKQQESFLWCAYDLSFLPVKVTSKKKDDELSTAIIKAVRGLGKLSAKR